MKQTHITFILDGSASMAAVKEATIAGFNGFVAGQKQADGNGTLTLVVFNTRARTVFARTPLNDVEPLNSETYVTNGDTALLDAIGSSIEQAEAERRALSEGERSNKVIFVILTDGYENSSRNYSRDEIFDMIRSQRDFGWEFVFLGANQDAIEEGGSLGIGASSSITFSHDVPGTASAFSSASGLVQTARQESNPRFEADSEVQEKLRRERRRQRPSKN
jgi:uncharacterized protein YegL